MSAGSFGITGSFAESRLMARIRPASRIIELFILVEFACQAALLSPWVGVLRVFVRCAAFGTSLLLLFLYLPGRRIHPAVKPAAAVAVLLVLAAFNPETNTALAATMQIALYIAILAPLLWVSNLSLDQDEIRRVLVIMLAFQATSSVIGILQVYFPGQFRGNISSVIAAEGKSYLQGLLYRNAYGVLVLRPSGLTDIPGGVGMAGQYTALMGLYFFLTSRRSLMRTVAVAAALAGVVAVYLSSVKSAMICLIISLATFAALFFWRSVSDRGRRVAYWLAQRVSPWEVLAVVGAIAVGGYYLAVQIGGAGVTGATQTLTQSAPTELFYQERGRFLEYTLQVLLPQYPFGAGLGRWGMMRHYFGDPANLRSSGIWVEVQWTAWLVDGGVPLILAYTLAILIAIRFAVRCAITPNLGALGVLGALVAAIDVGLLAGTFAYVPFITSMGMDFWLLNAMLFAGVVYAQRIVNRQVAPVNETVSTGYR